VAARHDEVAVAVEVARHDGVAVRCGAIQVSTAAKLVALEDGVVAGS
jgi:hypothetical protein